MTLSSLLAPVGEAFTLFHMYSKPDGKTVIDEVPMPVTTANEFMRTMFGGPAKNASVLFLAGHYSVPKDDPLHNTPVPGLTMLLKGDLVVEVSDGKVYRLKPGNILIGEDATGEGHRMVTNPTVKANESVQVHITPEDPDKFFEQVRKLKAAAKK